MYAIIETGGKQYRVAKGDVIKIEKLPVENGTDYEFDKVLLINNEGEIIPGTPYVESAKVVGEVLETAKDKKILVFKFKKRKNYKRKKGHRQLYTKLQIKDIVV